MEPIIDSRIYKVGQSEIILIFGDITTSKAEALVSSDDYRLSMGGGVSGAIRRVGGRRIVTDKSKMAPAQVGDVVVSTAGDLSAKYIFHAITIGPERIDFPDGAIVRQTTRRILELMPLLGCQSVAFPAIGAGAARIPYETVASEMAGVLTTLLLDTKESYKIELYLMDRHGRYDPKDFFILFENFISEKLGLTTLPGLLDRSLAPPEKTQEMNPDEAADAERRLEVYKMLRHLDRRRNQIESKLLKSLSEQEFSSDQPLEALREQLDELLNLRSHYQKELAASDVMTQAEKLDSVFVSSTSNDLKSYRKAVWGVINDLRLRFIGMEEFVPTVQAPADLIRQKVDESRIYLGILGMRYGYVDPSTGLSMTELEYRQAIVSKKQICMFIMDQSAQIQASMIEDDPTRFKKLLEFKSHVMKVHTCAMFDSISDLKTKAEATLKGSWDG